MRLTPGTYQLIAATNGERGYTLIHITKGKMSKITITQDTTPLLPSADDITFQNISSLRDNGLTNQQVNYVRLLFFAFNHNVQTVSIDTSTIRSIPYDPNSNNVTLGLNFNVVINNTPYTATVSYNDLTNIQLTLLDAQGSQVFSKDSTTITN